MRTDASRTKAGKPLRRAVAAPGSAGESRYRALFSEITDAVFVHGIRPDGMPDTFIEVNDAACDHLGYSRDELLRLAPSDIGASESPSDAHAAPEPLQAGGSAVFERIHITKDGRRVPVEILAKAITVQGQPAVLSVARDITARRRAEEERLALERRRRQAQKLKSLGLLAGGVAHDFNNLLMAVLGNVDLARGDLPPQSPAHACLNEIEKAARKAADLCRQMLAYSGRGRFSVKAVSLNDVIAGMRHMLEVSAARQTQLRFRIDAALPAIEADATQVQQVVMNLALNASEALEGKPGTVTISTGGMDVGTGELLSQWGREPCPAGRYVCVEVADSGNGIPAEMLPQICDPFFTTKTTGRGLGLAAVLGIVRGHKGFLQVVTEPGRGSVFRVLFPALQTADPRPKTRDEVQAPGRDSGLALVIDDEEAARTIACRMLERIGYKTVAAADAREGLAIFAEQADRIAFVLLDLTMPNMDGEQALQELRRIRPGARVLLCSGYDEVDVSRRFSDSELAGFLQKPYRMRELAMKLKCALSPAVAPP
jgi:PAS domain S-box-containing protein